jgi:hypothetical protein
MQLYKLTAAYENIWNLVDDETMDLTVLESALQQIEGQIEVKMQNSAIIVKGLETEVAAFKGEEKRLADRRRALENKQNWLKNYMTQELERMGIDKVKAGVFTVSLQNNPPAVEITGEVPGAFITIVPEQYIPDKKKISEHLKAGNEVEWAKLTQGKSLRVR